MARFFILISLLCLAILFYSIGFAKGAVLAFVVGIIFELGFWFGLFGRLNSNDETAETELSKDK